MKKIKCELCGHDIDTHQIKKHKSSCNGLGPRRLREFKGRGKDWLKNKTYKEVYGEEDAKEIGLKISKGLEGKITGKSLTEEGEKERKRKLAVSMRGNKNGATSFRRKNIYYKEIHFKSKWEVNVAKFSDDNSIIWKYEDLTYSLSSITSYTPDFSIYENGVFKNHIEVKGYFREENKIKFQNFLHQYPDILIEVWDKKILLNKKIPII